MRCHLLCKGLVLFLFVFCLVSGELLVPERRILLEFKTSVFDPSGILSSWDLSKNPNHCSWHGVSCNSRSQVTSINIAGGCCCEGNFTPPCSPSSKLLPLYGFGFRRRACSRGKLVGYLSPLIGKLTVLRVLSLAFNDIGGEIPLELWGLEKLEQLDLKGNSLTGKLPDEIVGLRNLRVLNLGFNALEGEIPGSLSKFVDLEVLNLAGNKLKGNCQYLEHLDLSGNFLVGHIPGSLGNCRQLRTLVLFSNMLDGVIPNELGQLHKLEVLDVARNNLSGFIPTELGDCVRLSILVLSNLFDPLLSGQNSNEELSFRLPHSNIDEYNSFQGSIPMGITTLPKLKVLWALRANLEGKLPRNWGGCENLEIINLAQNHFDGDVFGVFNGCKKLSHLDLSSNRLTGELDEQLRVPCMTLFDISGNLMSGSIPRFNYRACPGILSSSFELLQPHDPPSAYLSFFTCKTRLETILPFQGSKAVLIHNFGGNNFSGSLPWLANAPARLVKQIEYAFLAGGNNLTGSFPGSLFVNCNKLHGMIVNVSNNRLSGHIPSRIGAICRSLKILDVSKNQIEGVVPQSFRDLKSLVLLDLSGNKLRGLVPKGLYQLKNLKHLSLGSNNLSGAIPSSFGRFHSLEVSELSSNSLAVRSTDMTINTEDSQNEVASSSGNRTVNKSLGPIEIASIASGLAIVSVLLVLAVLFFYTRKWVPNSRVQAEIAPGISVAVKRLAVRRFQGIQQFHAEVKTLETMRHPNLVTLVGYHASETDMFLLYNYLPGGNLENFIRERSTRAVDWKIIHKIALDIAHALAYLHEECTLKVLHRDVKPSNILLDNDCNAYLSDFGLSRLLGTSETHATTGVAGTFGYVAPEYAMTCRVSEKADVYSYGIVLLELISDKKALDPSFSSQANGFNIVSWACMLLQQGQAKDVFTLRLWNASPHHDLVELLHLAVTCTVDSLLTRPTMRQVVRRLKRIQPSSVR
ncbi:hypothetical protein J1N35_043641 [Gossypium stocksii]|uniref:Protein kinase domain-containing protein n=1 Tax=Gossypium stocksii TaxID=47602 RepID=A0A9D3U7V2_9ROSI|nr:hypothetical protein J1N35_043641 [Gossypium stocksii]